MSCHSISLVKKGGQEGSLQPYMEGKHLQTSMKKGWPARLFIREVQTLSC
jgi:hypothetical protein